MSRPDTRLYLRLNGDAAAALDADGLDRLFDAGDVACVLLGPDMPDEAARAVAERAQARDIAVLGTDPETASSRHLDGVHVVGTPKEAAAARRLIGADGIVGYEFGGSRHDAMTAAERNADYVYFPAPEREHALWWAQVMTVPAVAEVDSAAEAGDLVKGGVEFVALSLTGGLAGEMAEKVAGVAECLETGRHADANG